MAATPGKKALLKVATAAITGPYSTAANIKSASIQISGALLDVSALGNDWQSKIQGMRDAKISVSGSYDTADSTGQMAIRGALLNDGPLYVQVLPDGVSGFQCQVRVASMQASSAVAAENQVSIELEQTGGVTLI